jgi:hypothetical protein
VSYETSNKALGRIVLLEERIAALEAERDALAATVEGLREALSDIGDADDEGFECAYCNWDDDDGCEDHCPRYKAASALATPPPAHLAKLKARERAAALREAVDACEPLEYSTTRLIWQDKLERMAEAEEEKAR